MSKLDVTLSSQVVWEDLAVLKPFPGNARTHPCDQIKALAKSISKLGWARPIGIDETKTILFGHGCFEAAKSLKLTQAPTLMLSGLSDAKRRALVIADNQLAAKSSWDNTALQIQLKELINLDFDVELTGFSMGEIDLLVAAEGGSTVATDDADGLTLSEIAISKVGDVWILGCHRLVCDNALSSSSYAALLGSDRAEMVLTDPPFNVRIQGHARGRGRKKHREFAMASGEMSKAGFTGFLEDAMHRAIQFSVDGSIHYWFIDWRHTPELLRAGLPLYSEWKNLLVWNKSNAGQGAFYRSKHELIAVFKAGHAAHINNFGLGAHGRYRANVLDYPGGATPDAKRQEELDMHPTVKPIRLIADLMLDCSRRNGLVLDPFGGSGTAILAAEETGRRARMIELDPLYVDLAIRRWQRQTGEKAVHEASGLLFDDMAADAPADA